MKRFIIFCGGNIFDYSVISLKNSTVLCADGGLYHARKIKVLPDVIIGDFDSYSCDIDSDYKINCRIIKCPPEKDDTDTMMCVKYAISHGADEIFIYGGLSGRFDHSIANIQTLKYCDERGIYAVIDDGLNRAFVQHDCRREYKQDISSYFSVFSLTESLFVRELSGVKYPLENYRLFSGFPLGVSNEIISERALLDISDGYALVVFSKKTEHFSGFRI